MHLNKPTGDFDGHEGVTTAHPKSRPGNQRGASQLFKDDVPTETGRLSLTLSILSSVGRLSSAGIYTECQKEIWVMVG